MHAVLKLALTFDAILLAACGSGPTQTGPIGECAGISLDGPGAFEPLSGMAYENTANLGGDESAPGTYEVVIWAGLADGGSAGQSDEVVCSELLDGDFASSILFVAPQTLELAVPAPLTAGSFPTTVLDFTKPYAESPSVLEDVRGNASVGNAGTRCLSGSFTANLRPVDRASGLAIDGGEVTRITGTFDVPFCG